MTRIRTWVTAATTQGTNHYTITASVRHMARMCDCGGPLVGPYSRGWLTQICVHVRNTFSWCSGYHICLTHRRSPVRSRAKTAFPRGLTARISGFHPGGPGSTPGVGKFLLLKNCLILQIQNLKIFVKKDSVTGNRTRATWVRARYPNH